MHRLDADLALPRALEPALLLALGRGALPSTALGRLLLALLAEARAELLLKLLREEALLLGCGRGELRVGCAGHRAGGGADGSSCGRHGLKQTS